MEFVVNLKKENDEKSTAKVRGLKITLNEEVLSLVIGIPKGEKWDKDDKQSVGRDKKTFFRLYETYKEEKNGIKIETLLEPWDEVQYFVLKYLTSEGRLSVVHVYHFRFCPSVKEPL